jgi:serine phosphatase RsbU (regulator of sigma subunit)
MDLATHAAVPRLGDWCSLFFVPEQGGPIERRVAHADPSKVAWAKALIERYPLDTNANTGVAKVIRTGVTEYIPLVTTELIDDALRESTVDEAEIRPILDVLSLTSVITVPLRTRRGVVGAIQFVSAESGRRYGQDDLALAQAAAGRIAGALENLWLTDQHRTISATLQRSFLPPALPEIAGLGVAVRYCPAGAASEVGGDFYDLFEIGNRQWAVVIGDVCGTGPDAAATTVIARHTVRAAARHGQDHGAVLEWINEAVAHSGRYLFCTACYATVTSNDRGSFAFTSRAAGHPLPVVIRADGRAETLGAPGTLLGVFEEINTHLGSATLERGDVLYLYTDGITDQPPPHDLQHDALVELFRASARGSDAEGIADDVLGRLDELRPMEQRHDDIALIVLRVA